MSKTILLLGKSGMLGSYFNEAFQIYDDIELHSFDEALDITDKKKLDKTVSQLKPDFIINCAAYTNVEGAEDNSDLAFKVNAEAVGYLAELSKKYDSTLIHFSTDYVFNGEEFIGYREDAKAEPINVYGESKLKGEELIVSIAKKYFLIRTSWLFGENGKNFVKTMVDLSKTKDELKVVGDQFGSPTYAKDLCESVIKNFVLNDEYDFGIYHITNNGSCSWYEFAQGIMKVLEKDTKVTRVSSDEYPTKAKRPHYSILLNSKMESLRPWRKALKEYLSFY